VSVVEIRDHSLWPKHIHGNEPLKRKLLGMPEGTLIELEVDGFLGTWKKMSNGKDGLPMPGIRAIGPARQHWHGLQIRRGQLVSISEGGK
jgi:hypothetical protein